MKKVGLIALIMIVSLSLVGCNTADSSVSNEQISALVQPERKMDLYGKIIAQEGNEYTVQEVDVSVNPTFGMKPDEKKAYMTQLDENERMALKESIRSAFIGEKKILVPVGIPIEVKTDQGRDAAIRIGSLEDISIGSYVSVWFNETITDRNIAEYIKKNFSN